MALPEQRDGNPAALHSERRRRHLHVAFKSLSCLDGLCH